MAEIINLCFSSLKGCMHDLVFQTRPFVEDFRLKFPIRLLFEVFSRHGSEETGPEKPLGGTMHEETSQNLRDKGVYPTLPMKGIADPGSIFRLEILDWARSNRLHLLDR